MSPLANEKAELGHLENKGGNSSNPSLEQTTTYDDLNEFTEEEGRKIVRKIDIRLVTVVGLMYCISLMDRTNLGAAVIAGMARELKLSVGLRYSLVTLVFFPTYIVFQFPSTIVIRYLGPRNHLAGITFLWGVVMIGMGFTDKWETLAALRVLLGVFEAGFFPGCVYLLSTWYVRYEMHKRYSAFYFIGSCASAFAGILAFGLMQMEGVAGYLGWRWIFIIEGILTVLISIVGWFLIVGFPDDAHKNWRFLTERETRWVIAKVQADRGDAKTEAWNAKKFFGAGLDLKIWGFAMIFCMSTTVTYALAFFLPLILRSGMGFSVGEAQCLVAPPYFAAGLLMYATGWFGDKYHVRGPVIVFNTLLAITGLPLIGFVHNVGVRYFGVFLVCMGANSNIPATMTYQANNIRGHWKRAFCSATLVGMGGIGGIIGSLVFRSQDAPRYLPGLYACIASQVVILCIVGLLTIKFTIDNRKAERGELHVEGGDANFRYTI